MCRCSINSTYYCDIHFDRRRPMGVGAPSPRRFSRLLLRSHLRWRAEILLTNPPFKPDIINVSFSRQVRSLTYDVISKHLHGHKMPQFRNAANDRQPFSRSWNFQKVTNSQVLTFSISIFFMHVIWDQIIHVISPIISIWGNTEAAHFKT